MKTYTGNVVDLINRRIFFGRIAIEGTRIADIEELGKETDAPYFIPGFVEAHVHIESSMLLPSFFAKMAVKHGTIAALADPHEITNVLGEEGIDYMISDSKRVPYKFYFGLPSCVPATPFETTGSTIDAKATARLIQRKDIHFLAEMMNFPGVVSQDEEVMSKINSALAVGKVVDGHAPGLGGKALKAYTSAGISTDHECMTLENAREKAELGMKILIREGSAARNFNNLIDIIKEYPQQVMFCSDDKHPDDLEEGHINRWALRALKAGHNLFNVLAACSLNPVKHYNLNMGLLRKGDAADFLVVKDFNTLHILSTFINGECVYDERDGYCPTYEKLKSPTENLPNRFSAAPITTNDLKVKAEAGRLRIICTVDGELYTTQSLEEPKKGGEYVEADTARDILKLVVYNRYQPAKPQVAFIKGFKLKEGAIASTIAHDSHNLIALGTNDEDLCHAINLLIKEKGGIAAGKDNHFELLALPIAGLISPNEGELVARQYKALNNAAHSLGTTYAAPFMTLSFMALLVIPELKLSDQGLFDGKTMTFTSLFAQ